MLVIVLLEQFPVGVLVEQDPSLFYYDACARAQWLLGHGLFNYHTNPQTPAPRPVHGYRGFKFLIRHVNLQAAFPFRRASGDTSCSTGCRITIRIKNLLKL